MQAPVEDNSVILVMTDEDRRKIIEQVRLISALEKTLAAETIKLDSMWKRKQRTPMTNELSGSENGKKKVTSEWGKELSKGDNMEREERFSNNKGDLSRSFSLPSDKLTEQEPVTDSGKQLERFRSFWSFDDDFADDYNEPKVATFDLEELIVNEVNKHRKQFQSLPSSAVSLKIK